MKFLGESVPTSGSTCSAPMGPQAPPPPRIPLVCWKGVSASGKEAHSPRQGFFLGSRTARSHNCVTGVTATMARGYDCLDISVNLF